MNDLTGPSFERQQSAVKNASRDYAQVVLEAKDKDRINKIGIKYLRLAIEKKLSGEKLSRFVENVIKYERA